MLVKPEVENFAKIVVVGVGGGGSNAISTMVQDERVQGVDFIVVNTDAQHLTMSPAETKIQIGTKLTGGLGSGGDPTVGKKSAEEDVELIHQQLAGADMVFITAGMGGGTGTGAAPIVADVARGQGALTVGVVTKPFHFEGTKRMMNAEEGIMKLKDNVDALIIIPNQRLLEITDEQVSLPQALKLADSVLADSVRGISDIIVMPGLINRDFADVRTIMKDAGSAIMGIGKASGEDRAAHAARAAIESPLLETTIEGAKGVLINITGGSNLTLREVDTAAQVVSEAADPDATIIFGATLDEELGDAVKITVIATGFDTFQQRSISQIKETVRHRPMSPVRPTEGETPLEDISNQKDVEMSRDDIDEIEKPAFLRRR
jgi:cell division protein FtsZ